ncbi:Hypothetical protein R9X50_00617200 [Acrodontium crateriforme]|uniref:Uncharacterized protein n=1 Tax=Acrodontium crateriforme TaxID=150365 RepID=A0AAQ3M8M0_9PEZI|nr:Hypothetical protein R9X50_00617200 [Acrodontium crateriforme]
MAASLASGPVSTQKPASSPRALAGIKLNAILADQAATSSEDEAKDPNAIPSEDVGGVIGVSIGREQTRLTSPKTPAIEKAAAIEEAGGFFGSLDGTVEGHQDLVDTPAGVQEQEQGPENGRENVHQRNTASGQALRQTQVRMPSPWRSKITPRGDVTKTALRDGLLANRKRSSSGPAAMLEGWQKALLSSLPSMPKNFAFTSSSSSVHADSREPNPRLRKRIDNTLSSKTPANESTGSTQPSSQRPASRFLSNALSRQESPRENEEREAPIAELPERIRLEPIRTRPSVLRRSTSDNSLNPRRTLSRVSSLGDDTRFEHVSEQVNSRFKAIKDSLQDSNLKLLPSISSFKPDFLRDRSSSFRQSETTENTSIGKPVDPMTRQLYTSTKAAFTDATANKPVSHPHLHRAMAQLEGDLIVLGGYRGSILRSAEPPHRQLWVPVKVGLNLRKVNLEVGLEEGDDERASETVIPGGMLTHIGPVDISRRLLKRLRACENARDGRLRVHDYGYDWRLHPLYLSRQLIAFLESLPCNSPDVPKGKRGATVIAHSLGGLITRHAVNQRPELFKGVVYAGVPRTCVNILGPLRNGDEVLLSSKVLTANVNFSIRTSFALLPLDGRCFFEKDTKEEYRVDFFDPQTWIDYRLSPCVNPPLPPQSAPTKSSGITGYVSSMANALPSFSRMAPISKLMHPIDTAKQTTANGVAEPDEQTMPSNDKTEVAHDPSPDSSTMPRDKALAYLQRILPEIKTFKQNLAFNPTHATKNAYPPCAVIYGKSTPTVYGARIVGGRDAIARSDAYDDLAFASGDGVVLAKAAMLPEGYTAARGGIVSSERGHVTLLGDLEAVGRCLNAILLARSKGVGYGGGGSVQDTP